MALARQGEIIGVYDAVPVLYPCPTPFLYLHSDQNKDFEDTPLETRIYEPSSYTCRDGETESRDVVWAAGHAGAVGEGWQGRGDCAVAGDNETLLLFSAGGVFKGHQLPRLHRARRQRWQDRGEESFSGRGAVACSACSLLLAAGGCVILQLIFSIKSIE